MVAISYQEGRSKLSRFDQHPKASEWLDEQRAAIKEWLETFEQETLNYQTSWRVPSKVRCKAAIKRNAGSERISDCAPTQGIKSCM